MLTVECITAIERLESLSGEWEQLERALSPRLPFASPQWALHWWRAFRRDNLRAHDSLHAYALRDAGGALVAIAPMFVTRRPGFGPVQSSELQFFGADSYVTEWRGVVCRPEIAKIAHETLARHVEMERPADLVQWRGLPAAMEGAAMGAGFRPREELGVAVLYMQLPDDWETLRAGLARNVKESLRKCYNSLARANHAFTFSVVSSPEEAPAALDAFFRLHASRSDARDTVDHPDVFANPTSQMFLRAYCDDMARRDALRIFQLTIGGAVVATRIGFLLDDELYMYFSGYDLAWSRFSVMTTTVAEAMKWAIAQKLRIFNFSTGADVSKTRWRPERADFVGGYSVNTKLGVAFAALLAAHRHRERKLQIVPAPSAA